jgi:hypothetical protein
MEKRDVPGNHRYDAPAGGWGALKATAKAVVEQTHLAPRPGPSSHLTSRMLPLVVLGLRRRQSAALRANGSRLNSSCHERATN